MNFEDTLKEAILEANSPGAVTNIALLSIATTLNAIREILDTRVLK